MAKGKRMCGCFVFEPSTDAPNEAPKPSFPALTCEALDLCSPSCTSSPRLECIPEWCAESTAVNPEETLPRLVCVSRWMNQNSKKTTIRAFWTKTLECDDSQQQQRDKATIRSDFDDNALRIICSLRRDDREWFYSCPYWSISLQPRSWNETFENYGMMVPCHIWIISITCL